MITREEYELLKQYRTKGYRWIARDEDEELYLYETEPTKLSSCWLSFNIDDGIDYLCDGDVLFQDIKCEDEKPTKIDDLIRDYESHQEIVGENVKVVIPSFVAEWIEECKESKLFFSNLNLLEGKAEVKNWIYEHDNGDDVTMKREEMVIKAYYDEYEIEEEKLYTVTLSNGYVLGKGHTLILFLNNEHTSWLTYETKLTQSEIESVDPILMQIAKPVEVE